MSKERFILQLQWREMIAPGVCHFAFTHTTQQKFSFIPGQFISLHWSTDEGEIKRSYSVATRQESSNEIELAASFVEGGFASEKLFNLNPGDTLTASGPYGRLVIPTDAPTARLILVATGTGVTPYRSMLASLAERAENVVILQGVRTPEHLLYGEEFVEFAERYPFAQFRAYYSRGIATQAHEYEGYVQSAFDDLNLDANHDIVLLCGNPNMIDQAFADLRERGFGSQSVRREKYISGK